ncbi:hypothetical protein [Legionella sp. CNM-4043-24]|uniref:hypothetical protein n=1 Tax=Legionella sp. CNM-4043-24 TaxID=3421646 RepID=UPI00403AB4B8
MKNPQHRKYIVLLLLVLVFASPGLAALLFYKHPQWLSSSSVNKGQLLTPPEQISGLLGAPKWRLILWNPGPCDSDCRQQLDKLARVRLALGRRLYEVEAWLINTSPLPEELQKNLADQDIRYLNLSGHKPGEGSALNQHARIFIANPDSFLILAYPLDDKPDSLFQDLKRLLSSNDKKSG